VASPTELATVRHSSMLIATVSALTTLVLGWTRRTTTGSNDEREWQSFQIVSTGFFTAINHDCVADSEIA